MGLIMKKLVSNRPVQLQRLVCYFVTVVAKSEDRFSHIETHMPNILLVNSSASKPVWFSDKQLMHAG